MTTHHFDTSDAETYGVNAAIILNNLKFWIAKNQANEKHFYDGKYWTYNSNKAFQELFPYMKARSIRSSIDILIDSDVIIKGNYNEDTRDRTAWYSLSNDINDNLQTSEMTIADASCDNSYNKETDNKPTDNKNTKKSKLLSEANINDIRLWIACVKKDNISITIDIAMELQKCKTHFAGKKRTIKTAYKWMLQAQQWHDERTSPKSLKPVNESNTGKKGVDAGDSDAYDAMMQDLGV